MNGGKGGRVAAVAVAKISSPRASSAQSLNNKALSVSIAFSRPRPNFGPASCKVTRDNSQAFMPLHVSRRFGPGICRQASRDRHIAAGEKRQRHSVPKQTGERHACPLSTRAASIVVFASLRGTLGWINNFGCSAFPQADFCPGTVSRLLLEPKCTARRASPRTAKTLTSLDPVLKMNAPATSISHDRPNHLALSHHREAG